MAVVASHVPMLASCIAVLTSGVRAPAIRNAMLADHMLVLASGLLRRLDGQATGLVRHALMGFIRGRAPISAWPAHAWV
jgi:hypothetical protein